MIDFRGILYHLLKVSRVALPLELFLIECCKQNQINHIDQSEERKMKLEVNTTILHKGQENGVDQVAIGSVVLHLIDGERERHFLDQLPNQGNPGLPSLS